ncbi:MAG TPA: ABC transporter permease [Spirochaetales bacterium]|nr:ABC transporter permease [Spirochaetales bacterium]HPG86217.1 ABC transporter permease [Spirochaetales bacterium]
MSRPAARKRSSFSRSVFVGTIVFLSLPLLVLVLYSFNESKSGAWTGFSVKWYVKLFTDSPQLWRAFGNSAVVALASAFVATVIGTLGAVAVNWYRFRLRKYLRTLTFMPMILPEIIIGVSLLVFFSGIGLRLSLFTVFVAHVSFNLPFVFLLVLARLEEFDFSIIEAARDLGASDGQTLLRVILPISAPGIISGFLTAVTLSLEDFVITFFVTGPGATTLPLYVYSAIRFGVSPVINALSVVMILGTVLLTWSTRNFLKYIAAK